METAMRPDFLVHPYGPIIAIALLDEYRAARAKPVKPVSLADWNPGPGDDDLPPPAAPAVPAQLAA